MTGVVNYGLEFRFGLVSCGGRCFYVRPSVGIGSTYSTSLTAMLASILLTYGWLYLVGLGSLHDRWATAT